MPHPSSGDLSGSLAQRLVREGKHHGQLRARARNGLVAGWTGIVTNLGLFGLKIGLGLASGSVSVVADAFYLISHLANSLTLTVSASLLRRPATAHKPFGHGRLEHVTPLVMAVILFAGAVQIGREALGQLLRPQPLHYWPGLPWVLAATVVVKEAVSRFVSGLGRRAGSAAILASAAHHRTEAVVTLAVIAGLLANHRLGLPQLDGWVGLLVAGWILYLGFSHGREALSPLLGQAPSPGLVQRIRQVARSVEGVADVHEIIVNDYGTMYVISLHVEVPARLGPERMHEIAERCEERLRKAFGGEVVAHTDPLVEPSPEVRAIEERFGEVLRGFPQISAYHDFRVVAHSPTAIIILADLDTEAAVAEDEFDQLARGVEAALKEALPNLAYAGLYVTPRFAY